MENFFLSPSGNCNGVASLEVEASALDRSSNKGSSAGKVLGANALRRFPNPVKDNLKVVLDTEQPFDGVLLFHDILGKLLKTVPYSFATGRNIIDINDAPDLPAGLISISVQNGGNLLFTRILKQ